MSKFIVFLTFMYFCLLQVQSQDAENRKMCESLYQRCKVHQSATGLYDDVTNIFNANCRLENRTWQTITRCQLERAACKLYLVKCDTLSCRNVAIAMEDE